MVNLYAVSEFGFQTSQQLTVYSGVDLTTQNLLGTFDCQIRNILTKCLTRFDELLIGFLTCCSDDLCCLLSSTPFGFFNDSIGTTFGIGQTRSRFIA